MTREYYLAHRETILRQNKESRARHGKKWRGNESWLRRMRAHREQVIDAYGGKCVCCGEVGKEFLTLDHIVPFSISRMPGERRLSGNTLYKRLIRNGFPSGYQILCFNCNYSKGNKTEDVWICPHKSEVVYGIEGC